MNEMDNYIPLNIRLIDPISKRFTNNRRFTFMCNIESYFDVIAYAYIHSMLNHFFLVQIPAWLINSIIIE